MKRYVWNRLGPEERLAALSRPVQRDDEALLATVRAIVDDVAARGWDAVAEHGERLDGEVPRLVPTAKLAEKARASLSAEQIAALELAARNIGAFHAGSLPQEHWVETMPGLRVGKVWRPIDRVGLYIPGGATPLFSTLLMLAIPARAAGVAEIVVATPPSPAGGLEPMVALAAQLCGIEAVWTVGGSQAIAALAFGAGPIPRVDKIYGPGNAYVSAAKSCVSARPGGPAIDLPAGPSELMVVADESAEPRFVAADLLSQAEHDPCAQVLLVTTSHELGDEVEAVLRESLPALPREEIAASALASASILVVESLEEAIEIANAYAPEHLSLAVEDPEPLVPFVRNAGAVFVGPMAAEAFGDYLAGPSHVLPTDGAARAFSGISVHAFLKCMSVQEISAAAAREVASPAALLARLEGLEAHALAADLRLQGVLA